MPKMGCNFHSAKVLDFMIKYSSYDATNFRPSSPQNIYLDSLEEQYRELLELRELVRKAEAAAVQWKRAPFTGADSDARPILLGAA
jgi:hypothetical protein